MVVLTRSSSRAASEDDHDTAGRVVEEEVGQDEDWEELCRRTWEVVRGL